MRDITSRQRSILDFIADQVAHQGRPPTLREIGAHFGITSTNGVSDHLRALEAKGYIERRPGTSRGIRVLGQTDLDSAAGHGAQGDPATDGVGSSPGHETPDGGLFSEAGET